MNRFLRMTTSVLLSSAAGVFVVGGTAAADTINIIATSDAVPRFELAAKVFKERTGHDVEITSTGYDQSHAMIVTSQQAKSAAFDIAKVDTIWVAGFARSGYCVPLDEWIDAAEWEDTIAPSRDAMSFDGKTWAKGGGNATVNFYYNEKLLKEAGFDAPPATLQEMISQARAVQEKGLAPYGTAWGWSQGEGVVIDYTWLVGAFGGKMQDDTGAFIFNNEAGVATLQWMVDQLRGGLADPASLTFDNRAVVQLFIKGDVPFMFNWPFTWTWGKDPTRSEIVDDIRMGVIPPYSGDSAAKSATVIGNSGHCVLASSQKKEVAWEFLKLASSAEMERRYIEDLNDFNTVTHVSIFSDAAMLEKHPQFAIFTEQYETAFNRPEIAWYAQFSSLLASALHRALTGGGEPKAVLDDVVGRLNELRAIYASAEEAQ